MKRNCLIVFVFGICLTLVILYAGGFFGKDKIRPGSITGSRDLFKPEATVPAEVVDATQWYEAVGTVRPRTETRVEAQVTGKVIKVEVRPGAKVKKGQVLIVLDDRAFETRLSQAREGLNSARSARAQAEQAVAAAKAAFDRVGSTYKRMKTLYDQKALTGEELDGVQANYLQAEAGLAQAKDGLNAAKSGVARAEKAVEEAQISLGYTTIRASEDGEVSSRTVEPGDLAFQGKTLLTIQTSASLQLEALVREGLVSKTPLGAKLPVAITALGEEIQGQVDEVVPSADPATRSFLVKVGLPPVAGLMPGMFGRLMVPVATREVVMIPLEAVGRVGQLETVLVETGGGFTSLFVTTGEDNSTHVEVLTGLSGNETIGVGGLVQ